MKAPDPRLFMGPGLRRDDNNFVSVKPVEMMDRPMAVTGTEMVRRGDRGADKGLGVANGGFHLFALGETGGDGRGQRASGAVGVLGGDARGRECDGALATEEIVDALRALPVAALDQHRRAAERQEPPALALARGRGFGNRLLPGIR